jgi:glycosyl transferase family 25
MEIMVINLDRHPERLEHISALLEAAQLGFSRVRAIDGNDLGSAEIAAILSPNAIRELSRFEVACLMSHRAAWERLLASDELNCCILEDDVLLAPEFASIVRADRDWAAIAFDVAKIETLKRRVWLDRRGQSFQAGYKLSRLRSSHPGAAGYIVSRRGAQRLLALTAYMDRPVDDILFDDNSILSRQLDVLQLRPALCIQEWVLLQGEANMRFASSLEPERRRLQISRKRTGLTKVLWELRRPIDQIYNLRRWLTEERMVIDFNHGGL